MAARPRSTVEGCPGARPNVASSVSAYKFELFFIIVTASVASGGDWYRTRTVSAGSAGNGAASSFVVTTPSRNTMPRRVSADASIRVA